MSLRYELMNRDPEIDAPCSPRLACLECGRVHDSVDLFFQLCIDCEEREREPRNRVRVASWE